MDHRKQAMILDGATDLYSLIRETLGIGQGDERLRQLDAATEVYVKQVLALEDGEPAARPSLRLVEGIG